MKKIIKFNNKKKLLSNKVILVTGSEGFIGGHLIKHLSEKNTIIIATHYKKLKKKISKKIKYEFCDIRNRKSVSRILRKYKPDEIYHLAAKSLPSFSFKYPVKTMNTNVFGTLNILEECRLIGLKSKILIACSSAQYGSKKIKDLPLREHYPSNAEHIYGLSKSFQNQLGLQYYKMYGLKVYRAIIFNTSGPGKKGDVFSDFCKQYILNKSINNTKTIHTGNLNKYRDFLHVKDLVRGLKIITKKGIYGEAYNLCSSKYSKINEIIDLMIAENKYKIIVKKKKNLLRKFDEKYIFGSNNKMQKIGWKPDLKISNIFNDMCKYYKQKI